MEPLVEYISSVRRDSVSEEKRTRLKVSAVAVTAAVAVILIVLLVTGVIPPEIFARTIKAVVG